MIKSLSVGLVLGAVFCGCGKPAAATQAESLAIWNRNLQVIIMSKGRCPGEVSELTNFPAFKSMPLPTPPPGKRLAIDPVRQQLVFVGE